LLEEFIREYQHVVIDLLVVMSIKILYQFILGVRIDYQLKKPQFGA